VPAGRHVGIEVQAELVAGEAERVGVDVATTAVVAGTADERQVRRRIEDLEDAGRVGEVPAAVLG